MTRMLVGLIVFFAGVCADGGFSNVLTDLEVLEMPQVEISPSPLPYLLAARELKLHCSIRSPLNESLVIERPISWTLEVNGITRELGDNDGVEISAGDRTVLLKPRNGKDVEKFEGVYRCVVPFKFYGNVASVPVEIVRAEIKDRFKSDTPRSLPMRVYDGNEAFIGCTPPDSTPPARVGWTRNGLNLTATIERQNDSYLLTEHGLHIANVNERRVGVYRCYATNGVTGETRFALRETRLVVEDENSSEEVPITIKVPEVKQTTLDVDIGSTLTLPCVLSGSTSGTTWSRLERNLPSERVLFWHGNLRILNVERDDAGTYVCRPKDVAGRQEVLYVVNIRVPIHLRLVVSPTPTPSSLDISCTTSSVRVGEFDWRYNGERLVAASRNANENQLGAQLRIVRYVLRRLDSNETGNGGGGRISSLRVERPAVPGVYQCVVSDEDGRHFVAASVFLRDNGDTLPAALVDTTPEREGGEEEGVVIETPPTQTVGVLNGTATLYCFAKGAKLEWMKEGVRIGRDGRVRVLGTGTALEIAELRSDDAAVYTCVARGEGGERRASARLHVVSEDDADVDRSSFTSNELGSFFDAEPDRNLGERPSGVRAMPFATSEHSSAQSEKKRTHSTPLSPLARIRVDAPEVRQITASSVVLTWTLPRDLDGFHQRVQFARVRKPVKAEWMNDERVLARNVREVVLSALHTGERYRFRIGFIFDDGDQLMSEKTRPYKMKSAERLDVEPTEPMVVPPQVAPVILGAKADAPTAISFAWKVTPEWRATLDGFIVQYRPSYFVSGSTIAALFDNASIIGGETREHTLDRLLPATRYEIRLSSFNQAGFSPVSRSTFHTTQDVDDDTRLPDRDVDGDTAPKQRNRDRPSRKNSSEVTTLLYETDATTATPAGFALFGGLLSNEALLVVAGSALGAVLVVAVIMMIVCSVRQQKQKKIVKAAKGKFNDTARRIYRENEYVRKTFGGDAPSIGRGNSNSQTTLERSQQGSLARVPPPHEGVVTANGHTVGATLYQNPMEYVGGSDEELDDVPDEMEQRAQNGEQLETDTREVYANGGRRYFSLNRAIAQRPVSSASAGGPAMSGSNSMTQIAAASRRPPQMMQAYVNYPRRATPSQTPQLPPDAHEIGWMRSVRSPMPVAMSSNARLSNAGSVTPNGSANEGNELRLFTFRPPPAAATQSMNALANGVYVAFDPSADVSNESDERDDYSHVRSVA